MPSVADEFKSRVSGTVEKSLADDLILEQHPRATRRIRSDLSGTGNRVQIIGTAAELIAGLPWGKNEEKSMMRGIRWVVFFRLGRALEVLGMLFALMFCREAGAQEQSESLIWHTTAPLYSELLGNTGTSISKQGVLMWAHYLYADKVEPYSIKLAQPYVLSNYYKNAARRNIHYFISRDTLKNNQYRVRDYADLLGLRYVLIGSPRSIANAPQEEQPWLADPKEQERYVQDLCETLKVYKKYIWGVCPGDELVERQLRQGITIQRGRQKDLFLWADNAVRDRYGFGRFGMPTSLTDPDRFRWIAYRRWLNDRFLELQQNLYKSVKSIDPTVFVLSPDPQGQVEPLAYSRYSKWTDIFIHQLYPRLNPHEQDFAWITKTVVDLGGKPFMACAHVENYAASFNPEEVVELLSQVYRAGGQGFDFYLPDTKGLMTESGGNYLDRFGSWPRWDTIMGIIDRTAIDPLPKFPESKAAIFFSNDAHMGEYKGAEKGRWQYRWMFAFLGPIAGGWFNVIDDEQIASGEIDLKRFRAIYVPNAEFQRQEVGDAIFECVKAGGTLVVTQPAAFTFTVDGNRSTALRNQLYAKMSTAKAHQWVQSAASPSPGNAPQLPLPNLSGAEIENSQTVTPILRYENGEIAAITKRVGRGLVYWFGFDPMDEKALGYSEWREYWKVFHASLGFAVDQPIWRFTFPTPPGAKLEQPPGVCLTNNYVQWITNRMVPMKNAEIDGSYSYSLAPDLYPDQGGTKDVSFNKGNLTDRMRASLSPLKKLDDVLQAFAVGWKAQKEMSITFSFKKVFALNRVWLIFLDQLPPLRVEGLSDGNWVSLGEIGLVNAVDANDCPGITIALAQTSKVSQMRIVFGAGDPAKPLIIPELEIWAQDGQ